VIKGAQLANLRRTGSPISAMRRKPLDLRNLTWLVDFNFHHLDILIDFFISDKLKVFIKTEDSQACFSFWFLDFKINVFCGIKPSLSLLVSSFDKIKRQEFWGSIYFHQEYWIEGSGRTSLGRQSISRQPLLLREKSP